MQTKNCFRFFSSHVRNFQDIPGPRRWPIFGNIFMFSPLGPYRQEYLIDGFNDLRKKYGNIVRLKLGHDVVLLFDPEDIRQMYVAEGKFPKRPTFEALKKYRKEKFNCVGIVPDNGEEWYYYRQSVVGLLHLKTVHGYWDEHVKIAQEFANRLAYLSAPNGELIDFIQHAFLYSLEAVGILCYGRRLKCLSINNEEGKKIAKANEEFLEALGKTFNSLPLWKLWKTKSYQTLESTQNYMTEIAKKYLTEAREKMSKDPEAFAENDPFLFELFNNTKLSETELLVVVSELYQGGIEATATTITMMLYHLARNSLVQNALYIDLIEAELKPGRIPPLLRACLKETLRLHPTAAANSRFLDSDAVLSSYLVPKSTLAIGVNPVISRMEEYFKHASKFDPWRWLSKENKIHPYAVLPFGHGARMCPGRRFAEQEIYLCVAEILKRYEVISFNTNEVRMIQTTNLIPDRPLSFGFLARSG